MGRLDLLRKMWEYEYSYWMHDCIKRHSTTGLKRLFQKVDYPCTAADKGSKEMSLRVVTVDIHCYIAWLICLHGKPALPFIVSSTLCMCPACALCKQSQ